MVAQTQERCGHEQHQEVRRPGLGWKHRIVLQACKRLGSCILLFTQAETWAYLWREWTWVALDSPTSGRAQEVVLNWESTYGTMRPSLPERDRSGWYDPSLPLLCEVRTAILQLWSTISEDKGPVCSGWWTKKCLKVWVSDDIPKQLLFSH